MALSRRIFEKRFRFAGHELDFWQIVCAVFVLVYGIVILVTFPSYGITSDEGLTVEYGAAIFRWYTSLFQDRSVFDSHNTWLYGGFLNTIVHLAHRVTGWDVYEVGHFCNAFVGLLGVVCAYRLGTFLGGRSSAGVLAMVFLTLTPRYYGHTFNNPRDIPFAVFYLWSVYYILRGTSELPDLSWRTVWKTGLAMGFTLGIRAGGVVLVGYLILAYGFVMWRRCVGLRRVVGRMVAMPVIAYGVMYVFWPWLQVHPVMAVWDTLATFSSFPAVHSSYFEGWYWGNNEIPWYYAPKWLLLTLPEFVFVGLGCLVVWGFQGVWRESWASVLVAVSAAFPLSYAVVMRTPLYDGLRHLLFVVPPLVVVSAWACKDFWTAYGIELCGGAG